MDMDWETWYCRSTWCKADAWLARPQLGQREQWQLVQDSDAPRFTVAAITPVCPLCGATLSLRIEIAETIEYDSRIEVGPLFEYARNLAW